jgi:hypothetical protein
VLDALHVTVRSDGITYHVYFAIAWNGHLIIEKLTYCDSYGIRTVDLGNLSADIRESLELVVRSAVQPQDIASVPAPGPKPLRKILGFGHLEPLVREILKRLLSRATSTLQVRRRVTCIRLRM